MKTFSVHFLLLTVIGSSMVTSTMAKSASTPKLGEGIKKQGDESGQHVHQDRRRLLKFDGLRVFRTSETFTAGQLKGLAGADAHCQRLADAVDLDGVFKAWLSDSTGASPSNRFIKSRGRPYVVTTGQKIADSWEDLIDGTLNAPIDRDEKGDKVGHWVFTGTDRLGNANGNKCNDWRSSAAAPATAGLVSRFDYSWTWGQAYCNWRLGLYCFEQDYLKVFATSTQTTGDIGGLIGADATCQTLAHKAGHRGVFKAWLSNSTGASPANRFAISNGQPYVLVTGKKIGDNFGALTDGFLDAHIDVDERAQWITYNGVFTGTSGYGTAQGGNCNDWYAHDHSVAAGGIVKSTRHFIWSWGRPNTYCSSSLGLYCFEQNPALLAASGCTGLAAAADDTTTVKEDSSNKLSKESIIGGSVVIAFFFMLSLVVVICMCRRTNRGEQQQQDGGSASEKDGTAEDVDVDDVQNQSTDDALGDATEDV